MSMCMSKQPNAVNKNNKSTCWWFHDGGMVHEPPMPSIRNRSWPVILSPICFHKTNKNILYKLCYVCIHILTFETFIKAVNLKTW